MKPLPVLLLNVVIVVVALAAYDTLQSEPAAAPAEFDASAIERRLDALETASRRTRRAGGTDASVLERLAALEAALRVPAVVAVQTDVATVDEEATATMGRPSARSDSGGEGELTADDVKRFRALREAVRREESIEKNRPRIDAALDALPLRLTDAQRETIHAKYADFQPQVDRIWTDVKTRAQATVAAGGQVDRGEIVSSTMAIIQTEFAETLIGVVPAADAAIVAGALHPNRK